MYFDAFEAAIALIMISEKERGIRKARR